MAEYIENKHPHISGEKKASNDVDLGHKGSKSSLIFLLRRIKTFCHSLTKHLTLCHPELVSGSHGFTGKTLRFRHTVDRLTKLIFRLFALSNKFGMTSFKKAFAFTLAETLIVMGIIGVVAALTIPNLNSSTADKEKIAKLQKIYSNLNDAFGRAEAVYGPFAEWQDDTFVFFDRMADFLKMTKKNEAYPVTQKDLNGATNAYMALPDYYYILPDGAVIIGEATSEPAIGDNHTMDILIDLDGVNKGAGTYGKDLFIFKAYSIENRGIRPLGEDDTNSNLTNLKNDCFKFGISCSSWVIKYGNMDYLKADRTGKCPNGKTLDITTNTSCK